MRELLTAIQLEPMKGNFKTEAGQILLQVKKSCTDVFDKELNHSYGIAHCN